MLHCLFLYSKPDKKRYTQQLVHATSSVLQKHFLAKVNMQIDKEVCVFLLMLRKLMFTFFVILVCDNV